MLVNSLLKVAKSGGKSPTWPNAHTNCLIQMNTERWWEVWMRSNEMCSHITGIGAKRQCWPSSLESQAQHSTSKPAETALHHHRWDINGWSRHASSHTQTSSRNQGHKRWEQFTLRKCIHSCCWQSLPACSAAPCVWPTIWCICKAAYHWKWLAVGRKVQADGTRRNNVSEGWQRICNAAELPPAQKKTFNYWSHVN